MGFSQIPPRKVPAFFARRNAGVQPFIVGFLFSDLN